ncbi:hypothetical protein D3C81_1675610 [compost metagenome]
MQPYQVIEHGAANIGHAPLTDPGNQIEAAECPYRQRQHQQQEQADGLIELVRRTGHEPLVHQQADALTHGQCNAGGHYQSQQRQQRLATVWAHEMPAEKQGATLT